MWETTCWNCRQTSKKFWKSYNFLCTIMSDNLTWWSKVYKTLKVGHQRFCGSLWKFEKFEAMVQFYTLGLESVQTFFITVWFGSLATAATNAFEKIVKMASITNGNSLQSPSSVFKFWPAKRLATSLEMFLTQRLLSLRKCHLRGGIDNFV